MGHHEDKSTIDERLTGVRDQRDPDGLLTVEQDAVRPDPSRFGTAETDTLAREQAYYARLRERGDGAGRTRRRRVVPPGGPDGPTVFG
jgi:hypothetical protein